MRASLAAVALLLAPHAAGLAQTPDGQASSILDLARRTAAEGRVRQAIEMLDRAVDAGRRSSELYELRGRLSLVIGDTGAAERDWRRAVELDPRNAAARVSLGRLMTQQGLWNDAIRLFREALVYDSRNVEAVLGLADAYERSGRVVGARQLVEAASQALNDLRLQQRWAQMALASGNPQEAERALVRLAEALEGPARRDALCSLAEIYVSQSRYDDAVAALREAQTIAGGSEPTALKTYDLLAQATDHLLDACAQDVGAALAGLEQRSVSREQAFGQVQAAHERLREIEASLDEVEAPTARHTAHATRRYAYSLMEEALYNALAFVDLGQAEGRAVFDSRVAEARAEIERLAVQPGAARGRTP